METREKRTGRRARDPDPGTGPASDKDEVGEFDRRHLLTVALRGVTCPSRGE